MLRVLELTHALRQHVRLLQKPYVSNTRPREIDGGVGLVVAVSSHESATFQGGGGHFCGRVVRLATMQGLLQFSAQREFDVRFELEDRRVDNVHRGSPVFGVLEFRDNKNIMVQGLELRV